MFKFSSSGLVASAFLFSSLVQAGLSDCSKNLAFQLTNVFQIGTIKFQYGNCEVDDQGHGYAAGIANFCTGTGDAWQVIQEYHNYTGGNDEFTKYDKILAERAKENSGSTSGLSGYCDAWQHAVVSQKFWSAQGAVFDKLYFTPSQTFADNLGLKLSVSQAALYDTAISRGTSDNTGSLGNIIKLTNAAIATDYSGDSDSTLKINGHSVDEIQWLSKFLTVRAKYEDDGTDNVHIRSFQYIIDKKEYVWTHDIQVLNNEGKPGNLTCDNTYLPYPDQKINSLAICGDHCEGISGYSSTDPSAESDVFSSASAKSSTLYALPAAVIGVFAASILF